MLGLSAALCLGGIGTAMPAPAWAHGDTSARQPLLASSLPDPKALAAIVGLLVLGWCVCVRRDFPARRRAPSRWHGGTAPWVLIGLLGLYSAAVPPHLVHHLGDSQSHAQECKFVAPGHASDQGIVQTVVRVPEPAATWQRHALPPSFLLTRFVPSPGGRSPPDLSS
jgi:hypothetical protein